MRIRTGKKIGELTSEPACYYTDNKNPHHNVRWVAVDDLIKWIEDCKDETAFNEWQIRKTTLIEKLTP